MNWMPQPIDANARRRDDAPPLTLRVSRPAGQSALARLLRAILARLR
jgi:hypothetical protein